MRKPARTSAWSSTIKTRIAIRALAGGAGARGPRILPHDYARHAACRRRARPARASRSTRAQTRRPGPPRGPRRAGLDRDHADIMGDDVVKLAGNPRSLLVGREPPVLVPLTLEPRGAFLELCDVGAARPKVITDQPGGDEEQARNGDGEGAGIAR